MRLAPLLLGVVVGLAAIVLAWSRSPRPARPEAAVSSAAGQATGSAGPSRPGNPGEQHPPEQPELPVAGEGRVGASDLEALRARSLLIPVEGLAPAGLRDTFSEARTGHRHEALDMLAPRGTRVLAADDGFVAKLFTSARGGLTVYQFDPTQTWCYYYAHLDGYAAGLHEGMTVRKGDLLGYVGTTGNAPPQTPHLHFAIFKLGPEKRWWQGTAIDPYPLWAGAG